MKYETCDICKGDIEHHADNETGRVYWKHGHNAQPILDGQCCDVCQEYVLHLRLKQLQLDTNKTFDRNTTVKSMANRIIANRRQETKERLQQA